MKFNKFLYLYVFVLFLILSNLYSQTTNLQVQEVSKFCHSFRNSSTWALPLINYPNIYCPDEYGFQVCQWDSTQGTIQRISNFGLNGTASEMVLWQNYLFITMKFNRYTHIQSNTVRLYKVDITNPINPVIVDSITAGATDTEYRNLQIVANALVATTVQGGIYNGLVVIDPHNLAVSTNYAQYTFFDKIMDTCLITRPNIGGLFKIFSVTDEHLLQAIGDINLPYPTEIFPKFIIVDDSTMISHTDEVAIIWHLSNIATWQQISFINDSISSKGEICSGYLIFSNQENYETFFHAYDISNLYSPTLVHIIPYPPGLDYSPTIYNMLVYGNYVFHYSSVYGYICLKFTNNNTFTFIDKCYDYNCFPTKGRRYGDYILQPVYYSGLACFNISDRYNPQYVFSLFEAYTPAIEINGHYMSARLYSETGDISLLNVYDISDVSNPLLVFSNTLSADVLCTFNETETQTFYLVDNVELQIKKYQIANNEATLQYTFPIPTVMETPVFANNILYMVNVSNGLDKNLYIFEDLQTDNPQPPTILSNFVHDYGWLYNAGDYVFIKSLEEDSPYCTFYNDQSNFQVSNGIYGFNFRNYVCVSRESGISLYNINDSPEGIITEDSWLSEFSDSGHIDWDDNYFYLFCVDHISIYSYTLTVNNDQVVLNHSMSLSNYPNPFNPTTTISFDLPKAGMVKLDIFNIRGQKVKSLVDEKYMQGNHKITWNGTDGNGSSVASGIYFAHISSEGKSSSRKLVLLK